MLIAIGSDLHLEFGRRDFDLPDADMLLLAGDICVAKDLLPENEYTTGGKIVREFLVDISKKYRYIILVPGNHEYYGGDIVTSINIINQYLLSARLMNITCNEFGSYTTNGVKVVYSTLWTDMNKDNLVVTSMAASYMNDYNRIKNNGLSFKPLDSVKLHNKHKEHLIKELSNSNDKLIVMTHHAPLTSLTNKQERPSNIDYCYGCTDMDDIIFDNDIIYWIYGHVHTRDENVFGGASGQTKFVSNCRGYSGHERMASTFSLKVIEV